MAQRRMFSPKIVGSDAFLDMPTSSRELYFQLGMYSDDDGFINPRKIMRMAGASEDDLKVLITKRFVIPFENGVVVIKHWKINNLIRKDFYQETVYTDQMKLLKTKENGAYTESVNKMLTTRTRRLGKDRIGKVKSVQVNTDKVILETANAVSDINPIMNIFKTINPVINFGNTTQRKAIETLVEKMGVEKIIAAAKYAISIQADKYAPTITSPVQLLNKYGELQAYFAKQNKLGKPKESKHLTL